VRFHINADHELCSGRQEGFVPQLNRKELNDTLKTLNGMCVADVSARRPRAKHTDALWPCWARRYARGRLLGQTFAHEPEMHAYYLLLQLDSNDRVAVNLHTKNILAQVPGCAWLQAVGADLRMAWERN
jgi:hypothetical protein